MLGVRFDPEYERQLRATIDNRTHTKKNKRPVPEDPEWGVEFGHDEIFAFIAGFTPDGAPFGLTWEEMEAVERLEAAPSWPDDDHPGDLDEFPDDIPF